MSASSSIDVGQAVARKGKRQRRQKTEEEQEQAAAQQEEEVEQEEQDQQQQAKRAKKSEKKGAAAASAEDADGDAAMAEPAAAEGDEAAAADGGDAAVEENKSGQVGSGYLKPEVLLYFKNLAEILEKNEFESEEDLHIFLQNVFEELCGGDQDKLRALTRRGVAGDAAADGESSVTSAAAQQAFVLQRLCSHAKCSRLVENILLIASADQIGMFFTALGANVVDVLSDRYGSHVLESVLFRLPALLKAEDEAARGGLAEAPRDADARVVRQRAKTEAAWKNVGTHSRGSVAAQSDPATLPLRAHFFALVAHLEGSWLALAQNAHASFLLRHLVHVLQGEENIQALAGDSAGAANPAQAAAAAAAATAAVAASASGLPAYLLGLEELLPWIVQEVCAGSADELEAAARSPSGAPVLQTLLRSMAKLARVYAPTETAPAGSGLVGALQTQLQSLCAALLQFQGTNPDNWTPESLTVTSKNHITVLLQDRSGSRLLESVFELGGAEVVSALFACHMRGRLLELSKHAIANFCVQHLLQSVRAAWSSAGRHILRDAFEELSPSIEDLCTSGRSGVVLKLLDACVRVQVKENKLFKIVSGLAQASFAEHTPITSNVVGGLLLTPLLKSATAAPDSVSVIGSLMVQSCLQPARGLVSDASPSASAAASSELAQSLPFTTVLNAFLMLPPEFILKLALDPAGSHVFDAFLQAPCALTVKQQILRRFQMKWVDLALSNSGSYVLERLFALAPNQLKVGIAGDLCRAEKRVASSRSGGVLFRKLRLEHYKRHQASWLSSEESRLKKSRMFDDFLLDEVAAISEKKKSAGASKEPKSALTPAEKAEAKAAREKKDGKKKEKEGAEGKAEGGEAKEKSSKGSKKVKAEESAAVDAAAPKPKSESKKKKAPAADSAAVKQEETVVKQEHEGEETATKKKSKKSAQ